jgi:hypothetical protein
LVAQALGLSLPGLAVSHAGAVGLRDAQELELPELTDEVEGG